MSVKRDIMSDAYEKQTINFDRTVFERPDDLDKCPPPERIVYHSMEELIAALKKGEEDIKNGRTIDAYEALERLRKKYAL